jgi:3-oxoacid CoA-transferase
MKDVPQLAAAEAAHLVPDGATLMVGGFGMTGNPVHLLHALAECDTKNFTIISNNVGEPGLGGGRLLRNGQIRKAIGSFFTSNPEVLQAVGEKKLTVQLIPQGTLAEAIRAGGAGIGGFFTPTAAGTILTEDDEKKIINGVEHVFVPGLQADVALLRAYKADTAGNLVYKMTERNFNPAMATAAKLVIAEVEEIVPVGTLCPDEIVTPGIYVDYLVQAHTTLDDLGSSASIGGGSNVKTSRLNIARRAFAELKRGDVVNLGVGIPTLVADLISPEDGIILHTENGLLGVGPAPESGGAMEFPVNAGKQPVTALPGASYFDSSTSFAMIRGGHVDVAIMGGLQVDEAGNLANWAVPGKPLLGVAVQWIWHRALND